MNANIPNQTTLSHLLPSAAIQVRMLQMMNSKGWSLERQVITGALDATTRHEAALDRELMSSEAILLDIGLWTFGQTLYELVGFLYENGTIRVSCELTKLRQARQRHDGQFRQQALSWKVVDFGKSSALGSAEFSPDLAVLWAVACNAKFIEALNHHFNIDTLWLEGTNISGKTPYFEFHKSTGDVELKLGHPLHDIEGYSVPRLVQNPW